MSWSSREAGCFGSEAATGEAGAAAGEAVAGGGGAIPRMWPSMRCAN